jgi:hypothetical protein
MHDVFHGCTGPKRASIAPPIRAAHAVRPPVSGRLLSDARRRESPEVCFEVEDLRHLPTWSSVIIQGRYEELHGEAAASALDRLMTRLQASPPGMSEMPWQGAGVFAPEPMRSGPR